YTSNNVLVASIPFTTTVSGSATAQTILIDTPLTPGDYYLKEDGSASLFRNTSGATFPYSIADLSITGTSFTNATYYYNFYNWQVGGSGCSSPMVEVPVIVEPKPAFELSTDKLVSCENGTSSPVTITTNLGGYDTFVWMPSTGVSGDEVNGWTFTTTHDQDYVLSASQSNGICEHLKTVRVLAAQNPEPVSTLANNYDLCKDDIQELKALEPIPSSVSIGVQGATTTPTSPISAFVQSAVYSK